MGNTDKSYTEFVKHFDMIQFFKGYVYCALWSSMDDHDEPLDRNYDLRDIAPSSLNKMNEDCNRFVHNNLHLFQNLYVSDKRMTPDQCGHDFWLTRNGHGAGFFDRGLGELGNELTEACKAFGECSLVVGDDDRLYLE